MKVFDEFENVKDTEKASLLKVFSDELDKQVQFWLPKSKYEISNNSLEIEDEIWEEKLEEIRNPVESPYVIIYVAECEESEKAHKLILNVKLSTMKLHPWLFIPKSIVIEKGELDTDDKEKKWFKVPLWFWEKSYLDMVDNQLEFFNKDREEEPFSRKDFKLLNKFEE